MENMHPVQQPGRIPFLCRVFGKVILLLALTIPAFLMGQQFKPVPPIVCDAGDFSVQTYIPAPAYMKNARSGQGTADIDLTFFTVPVDVQAAVRFAAEIWEGILVSNVPIRASVEWLPLEPTSLASARPTVVFQSSGLPEPELWYPVALAESLLGEPLNEPDSFDIRIVLNSNQNWYLGTDGQAPRSRYDMVTVILHEIAHGLGFFDTSDKDENGEGVFLIQDRPIIYDAFMIDADSVQLIDTSRYPRPSLALLNAFQSEQITFGDPEAALANGGENPILYAPPEYTRGSSLSHLDGDVYPAGDPNSLMTAEIARGEVIHSLGPITEAIMRAIGWNREPLPQPGSGTLALFPNPVSDNLTLELSGGYIGRDLILEVWDIAGRRLLQERREGTAQLSLRVSDLSPGIYLLHVRNNNLRSTARFMVAK